MLADLFKKLTGYSERRTRQRKRWDLLEDDTGIHIDNEVQMRFQDPVTQQNCRRFRDTGNNSFKLVVNKLATVYKNPSRRTFRDNQPATDLLSFILDTELFDLVMEEVNRIVVACNECFVRPRYVEDEIVFDILLPHEVEASGTATKIKEILYPVEDSAGSKGFEYYDDRNRLILDVNGNPTATIPHDYGQVPWIIYRRYYPVRSFWSGSRGEDLVAAYFDQVLSRTWINCISYFQSFKQLAKEPLENADLSRGSVAIEQRGGPESILEGKFTTLDLRTDLSSSYKVVEDKMNRTAANYNISSDVMNQSRMSSGLERLLSHSGLNEVRKDLVKIFRPSDKKLMLLIAKEWNLFSTGAKFTGDLQPSVDYGELQLLESPLDKIKIYTEGSKIGVESPVDYIMEKDPDIRSREDAMEIIKRNTDEIGIVLESRRSFYSQEETDQQNGSDGGKVSGEVRQNQNQMTMIENEGVQNE